MCRQEAARAHSAAHRNARTKPLRVALKTLKIALADHFACTGSSVLHRLSAGAKLLCMGLLIAATVSTREPLLVLAIGIGLLLSALISGIPSGRLLLFAFYPASFFFLLGVGTGFSGLAATTLLLGKALVSMLATIILMFTTPYPAVMAVVGRFLPQGLGQILLLCYRSLFILAGLLSEILTALRLRGGLRLRHLAAGLGLLVVRGSELAEQHYRVMQLRGYDGRALRYTSPPGYRRDMDAIAVAIAAAAYATALFLRIFP